MKLLLFTIAFTSFSTTAQYKDSLKTFRKFTKTFQKTSDYCFIPSGSFVRGANDSDIPTPDMNGNYFRSHVVSIDSFFMGKFEISNEKYLEFVNDVSFDNPEIGKTYLPDTLVWRMSIGRNDPYVKYYLRHPAYRNYPVVGVSYSQVKAYAEWATAKYNANEKRIFKKVIFRIPTEEEWEFASKGGHSYTYLPWDSGRTLDENGEPRANFHTISQLSVYRDSILVKDVYEGHKNRLALLSTGSPLYIYDEVAGRLNDNDLTSAVNAFEPNSYGLYQMAGNVEEMVDAYYLRDANAYSFAHDVLPKYDEPWGVTKGGSWNDTGYYLQYPVRQYYSDQHSSSSEIGFRLVMEVLEY